MGIGATAAFTPMTRGALALATGLVAVYAAAPAHACAISLPSCISASNGRTSEAYINPTGNDTVSLFFEYNAAGDRPERMALVECKSRKGVEITLRSDAESWLPPNEVTDYLTEVATSEKSYTLSQIRAGLRALGSGSKMMSLPAGHCGCELPKMETIGCGDFGP
jgi:hypothetical protein